MASYKTFVHLFFIFTLQFKINFQFQNNHKYHTWTRERLEISLASINIWGVLRCCACVGGEHNSKQLQLAREYYIIAEIMGSKDSTG